jgi:site-specific recombinase XerD
MEIDENGNISDILEKYRALFFSELRLLNYSPKTTSTYSRILEEFIEFLNCENSLNTLTIKDLNKYFVFQYFEELKKRKLSKATLNLHLKVIKRFFKFISENNESGVDLLYPIEKVTIKLDDKEIVTYTKRELEKIKEYLFNFLDKSKNYERYKNALCISFILFTGMRASECLNIEEDNVEIAKTEDNQEYIKIKILGKGNKERYVYLDEVFIDYLNKLHKLKPVESKYLFSKLDKKPMQYMNIFTYNKRLLEKLYINPKKAGLHIYRHTLASNLVEQNINLETIKEILGHSDISITSRYYAKVSEKAKREAMIKTSI